MWISKTLVVVLVVLSFNVMAEPEADHGKDGAGAKGAAERKDKPEGAGRAIAPDPIRTKDVDLIAKLFSHLGKDYATSIFTVGAHMANTDYLPWSKALEKAKTDKDETDTSATMAVLFGTVKEENREAVLKQITEVRDAEQKKDKDKLDPKYMDLLNRLFWAGKAVTGVLDKSEEAQAFLKKFVGKDLNFKDGDFKKIQDQNEDVLSKIKAAQGGDTTAKQFLRDNLNRGAALAYAKDQIDKGNKDLGAGLVNAVAWKQNGTGPKFIDMVGPGNEPQRLFIGESPAEIASAMQAIGPKLNGTALAQKQFDKVAKEWWVKDGKLTPGVPPGATSAISTGEEKKEAQKDAKPTGSGTGGSGGTGSTGSTGGGSFDAAKASTLISTTCTTCHQKGTSGSGSNGADFKITLGNHSGKTYSIASLINAINSGPMKGQLQPDVEAKIKAWADAK